MSLSYGEREGEFINNTGEVVCFEASVYNGSKSYLLIKKEPFNKYLEDNNLQVFWSVLGEKQIISGNTGRLEFSGAYYFNGMEIKGKMNIANWLYYSGKCVGLPVWFFVFCGVKFIQQHY